MKNRKRLIIGAIVLVVVVIAFFVVKATQGQASKSVWQTEILKRGELTAIVGATGMVRSNQSAALSWQTSGQIAKINADLDDRTPAGFILAELDKSTLPQSVILAEADLVTAKRNLEDLQISESVHAKAYQALVQAQKALDDAQKKRESKDYARAEKSTLDQAQANFILADEALKQAEDVFSFVADLPVDDARRAQGLLALSAARANRDRALANLNYLLSKPDSQEIAEADALVNVSRANLEDAQREWERVKNGTDPDDLIAAEARVKALEATINLYRLETPFAGTVTLVASKAGDQVAPGTVSFRIDDLSHLLVDLQVPEVDINRVKIGMPARITFDAIQNKDYKGKVTQVARIGTPGQGVVNFTVTVELVEIDEEVKPGMTAAVNIVVNQLSDVLLVPNRAVRYINGKRVVYTLKNGQPQPVTVEIGATSESFSQLVGGELKEGDTIVLNPVIIPQGGGGSPQFGD